MSVESVIESCGIIHCSTLLYTNFTTLQFAFPDTRLLWWSLKASCSNVLVFWSVFIIYDPMCSQGGILVIQSTHGMDDVHALEAPWNPHTRHWTELLTSYS